MTKRDLDSRILALLPSFDGVPSATALHDAIPDVSIHAINRHLNSNPSLRDAAEARAVEWLESLDEGALLRTISGSQLTTCPYEKANARMHGLLDGFILRRIASFDGLPTPTALAEEMHLGFRAISRRFRANAAMRPAVEERAVAWMGTLKDDEFVSKFVQIEKDLNDFDGAKARAREILGRIIAKEKIPSFKGLPSATALAAAMGLSTRIITKCFESVPGLKDAAEARAVQWLDGLEEQRFLDNLSSTEANNCSFKNAKRKIRDRLKAIIASRLESFDGIPSANALAEALTISRNTVQEAYDSDTALRDAAEARAIAWMDGAGDEVFLKRMSNRELCSCPFGKARTRGYEIVDRIIMDRIPSLPGPATVRAISRSTGVSDETVQARLCTNPSVWLAFCAGQGLSADQAVELALERGERTDASDAALGRRLRNLSAFREMAGLIRCFGNLLQGSVACVSLYPDPLTRAAEETGADIDPHHVPMGGFKSLEGCRVLEADTVILHSIHRLSTEALTKLFQAVHENLAFAPTVIATFGPDYSATDATLRGMVQNGFSLVESGVVAINPPGNEALEACGVRTEDLARMRRKLAGELNVLVFEITHARSRARIASLEKLPSSEGNGEPKPEAIGLDVPAEANRQLDARFRQGLKTLPSERFLVEVIENAKPVALIGFDMNPKRPKMLETAVYPGAPAEDYRKMARTLAENADRRRDLGANKDTVVRVPRSRL